nr:TnsD family Tn7-like transposition protein [Ottowia testudinis]
MLATWLFDSAEGFLARCDQVEFQSDFSQLRQGPALSVSPALGPDPRKDQLASLLQAGLTVTRASRELGVDTNTGMAWAAEQGFTIRRRPKVLTSEVRKKVIRLLKRGVHKAEAATAGNVSVETITSLLRSEVGLHQAWKDAQFEGNRRRNRRRWVRWVSANPHSGVKAARLAEPAVYAWLYRNDRTWLAAQTVSMERVTRNPRIKVDWDARDRQLSNEVKRLALELHESDLEGRIKLWSSPHLTDG